MPTFLRELPIATAETLGLMALRLVVFGVGGLLLTLLWRSALGLRTRGAAQAARVRVFGQARPEVVELGADGVWRSQRELRAEASERRAAVVLRCMGWSLFGIVIVAALASSCTATASARDHGAEPVRSARG